MYDTSPYNHLRGKTVALSVFHQLGCSPSQLDCLHP